MDGEGVVEGLLEGPEVWYAVSLVDGAAQVTLHERYTGDQLGDSALSRADLMQLIDALDVKERMAVRS